jgi:hypothetical protein
MTAPESDRKDTRLTAEDWAAIEENVKKWAARAHLIPDHVWLKAARILNSPTRNGGDAT